MAKGTKGQRHARVHQWERDTAAYQSLRCEARALLIEFRLLYTGRENRVYLSTREIMRRLDVGQRKAVKARDELLDRGFIRILKPGAFSQKTRNATEYALTNEPITQRDGDTAPKDYMRWQPEKNTVVKMHTDGMRSEYRAPEKPPEKQDHGMRSEYCQAPKPPTHGIHSAYTGSLSGGRGEARSSDRANEWLKMALSQASGPQFRFCLATVALAQAQELAA
jgi:hypothetical protein